MYTSTIFDFGLITDNEIFSFKYIASEQLVNTLKGSSKKILFLNTNLVDYRD